MSGQLSYWVANWNLSRAQAAVLLGNNNAVDMVDCTSSALTRVLPALESGAIRRIAGYVTGTPDIRWTASDFARVPRNCVVLDIDQSDSNLPIRARAKLVSKDIESGASTIATAVEVARERIPAGEDYLIYCEQSVLAEVEQAMGHAGLIGHIVAYQWASPSSNPDTRLPGTNLSLREANADLSVIHSSYMPLPGPTPTPKPPAPHEKLPRAVVEYDPDDYTWKVSNYPWGDEAAGK